MPTRSEMAQGLLRQTPDAMASQLVMWDNMSLWRLALSKARRLIEAGDPLREQIEKESAALQHRLSGAEMRVELLQRLSDHLEITLPMRLTDQDVDNLCERITRAAIGILQSTDKEFRGSTTQQMTAHVLKKLFDDLSDRFEKQDVETQERIVQSVMAGIEQMSEEQRERLRKELDVDELTEDAVRQALITGALGAAFAVLIEVAGFSAYVVAVKILAGIAALVGITLPFAVYTALTSLIAFIANPLILLVLLAGMGHWLNKRTTRKIRDGLTPIFVTQAIVNSALGPVDPEQRRDFLSAYEQAMRRSS